MIDNFLKTVYRYALEDRSSGSIYEYISMPNNLARLYNNRAIGSPLSPYIVYKEAETTSERILPAAFNQTIKTLYTSIVDFCIFTNEHQVSSIGNLLQSLLVKKFHAGVIPAYQDLQVEVQEMQFVKSSFEDTEDYFMHKVSVSFYWIYLGDW